MYVLLTCQIFFPDIKLKSHRIISRRLISAMTAIYVTVDRFSPNMYAFLLLKPIIKKYMLASFTAMEKMFAKYKGPIFNKEKM